MKRCITCRRTRPIGEFYGHPKTADGRLSSCKDCCKEYQSRRRSEKRSAIAVYDKTRSKTKERKADQSAVQKKRRIVSPAKTKARDAVNNAIRDGRLTRQPCRVCGSANSQAHHADYSRPLEIDWLCFEHHRAEHGQQTNAKGKTQYGKENTGGENAGE